MCKNVTDPTKSEDDPDYVIGIYNNKKHRDQDSDKAILYGEKCKSEEEIAEYLYKHGEVKIQYFSNKINMKKMDGRPTFSKNSYFGAYRLYADRHYYTRTNLQFNSVKVQDDLI